MERVPLQVHDDPTGDWQKAIDRNKANDTIFVENDIVVVIVSIVVESIDNEFI